METETRRIAQFVGPGDRGVGGPGEENNPTLRRLGLSDEELAALRRQGTLTCDARGYAGGGYWRIRFRFRGRMRAVYLGRDEELVATVRSELARLQGEVQAARRLRKLTRSVPRILRQTRAAALPFAERYGYRFHGHALRTVKERRHDGCFNTDRPGDFV